MTHLDIINRALVAVGTNPRTLKGLEDGTDNEVSSVKAFYESCWREVLSAHPWSELLGEESLTGTQASLSSSEYMFDIPESSIRIVSIYNAYGIEVLDIRKRGRYLYSKYDELTITFVTTENILPVLYDYIDYEIEADIPPSLDEVVSLRLASQIVFRISQNQDLQTQLHNRYMVALQNAKMNDMQGSGGMSPWTSAGYSL